MPKDPIKETQGLHPQRLGVTSPRSPRIGFGMRATWAQVGKTCQGLAAAQALLTTHLQGSLLQVLHKLSPMLLENHSQTKVPKAPSPNSTLNLKTPKLKLPEPKPITEVGHGLAAACRFGLLAPRCWCLLTLASLSGLKKLGVSGSANNKKSKVYSSKRKSAALWSLTEPSLVTRKPET